MYLSLSLFSLSLWLEFRSFPLWCLLGIICGDLFFLGQYFSFLLYLSLEKSCETLSKAPRQGKILFTLIATRYLKTIFYRLIYTWFLLLFIIFCLLGFTGVTLIIASFIFYEDIGRNMKAIAWIAKGVSLLSYALYYGILTRDFAQICAEKMSSSAEVGNPSNSSSRTLINAVELFQHCQKKGLPSLPFCRFCSNPILTEIESTRLLCSHEYVYRMRNKHQFH